MEKKEKVHHVVRRWSRPLLMKWGTYFCPGCGGELEKIEASKVVNSRSEEAKNYDFSSPGGDGYMFGNVKFIWTEYKCTVCDGQYTVDEVYQAEKSAAKCAQNKQRCGGEE